MTTVNFIVPDEHETTYVVRPNVGAVVLYGVGSSDRELAVIEACVALLSMLEGPAANRAARYVVARHTEQLVQDHLEVSL